MSDNKTLTVNLGERSYPIHIGERLLERAKDLIPIDLTGRSVFIVYDKNVQAHMEKLQSSLKAGRIETLSMAWLNA